MKFEIDKCPKCGGDIHGTEDTLCATAELIRDDETGEYEYEGRTEIWWDSQTTDAGPSGHPLVRCSDCEHIWETPCDEYPPAVADESEATAPDLLEALKSCVNLIETDYRGDEPEQLQAARDAIAKATEGTQ